MVFNELLDVSVKHSETAGLYLFLLVKVSLVSRVESLFLWVARSKGHPRSFETTCKILSKICVNGSRAPPFSGMG